MKVKLTDSTVFTCKSIEFKGGQAIINNSYEIAEEQVIRITDDDYEEK